MIPSHKLGFVLLPSIRFADNEISPLEDPPPMPEIGTGAIDVVAGGETGAETAAGG